MPSIHYDFDYIQKMISNLTFTNRSISLTQICIFVVDALHMLNSVEE